MADGAAKREAENESGELSMKTKKVKANEENGRVETKQEREPGNVLSGFQLSAVLSDSAREKNIFIHGKVCTVNIKLDTLNAFLKDGFLVPEMSPIPETVFCT